MTEVRRQCASSVAPSGLGRFLHELPGVDTPWLLITAAPRLAPAGTRRIHDSALTPLLQPRFASGRLALCFVPRGSLCRTPRPDRAPARTAALPPVQAGGARPGVALHASARASERLHP